MELPFGLQHAIEAGECVLFIGAGVGRYFKDQDGNTAPDSIKLSLMMQNDFKIDIKNDSDLTKISQIIELRHGRKELEAYLSKTLGGFEPDETFRWISSVKWKAIYTTNYDSCIERSYELSPNPVQNYFSFSTSSNLSSIDPRFDIPIYHLHGALSRTDNPQIIITRKDYSRFRNKRQMLFNLLKVHYATSTILYIGYSNKDPNWELVLEEITEEFLPSELPKSYRIDPCSDDFDIEILKDRNIETIKISFDEFVKEASSLITNLKTQKKITKSDLPEELLPIFDKSPISISRLINSWIHVNSAPFHVSTNLDNYLKGDKPTWSLIGEKQFFKRDIEDTIYDNILEYITITNTNPFTISILGSAGYGTTTLLMSIAARCVQEYVGPVFMLKPGMKIIEGDLEFACSNFDSPIFIIDNASDHIDDLYKTIQLLRNNKLSALFLLGERINEWRQCNNQVRSNEYLLEPLSDDEINKLLDFLAKNGRLNKLELLDRDMQFNVIKDKHEKELLIAMRESTEDSNFDVIIEDEYRGIGNIISKELYLAVCCFYQHGAYIRDSILAEIFDLKLEDLYYRTNTALEGLVRYECIDNINGHYVARSRHRTIASIVWEHCGDHLFKENLLLKLIHGLNLVYSTDINAFDCLIRSDRIVDSLSRLEDRINFFNVACKKDPDSPYVRQHYARMLSRSNNDNLALQQINEALKIDKTVKVLHHTKGVVLASMALKEKSIEIARKKLAQSEKCFQYGICLNKNDAYSYQCLADLYLEWSKKCDTDDEIAEYIAKAEETITEGLKNVRNRDSLWIVSSKIQKHLGKNPAAIKSLLRAIEEKPSSIIPRYLLGRLYRKNQQPEKTIEVLDYIIKTYKDEFRSFVDYSLALVETGESYAKAITYLRLSTLYGLSDPRFIATLGGMLYMDGKFTEADAIFQRCIQRNFNYNEQNEINYYPFDPINFNSTFSLKGVVRKVQNGYSLIQAEGYPVVMCPASKYRGLILKNNMSVTFELAFRAKGPIAKSIKAE